MVLYMLENEVLLLDDTINRGMDGFRVIFRSVFVHGSGFSFREFTSNYGCTVTPGLTCTINLRNSSTLNVRIIINYDRVLIWLDSYINALNSYITHKNKDTEVTVTFK